MDADDRVIRERELLAAVLSGDEQAWRAWYDASFQNLAAYVGWRCAGLPGLREEALQETWLTAIRRIRSFVPERASFRQWLRGIAANVIRNQLRNTKRQQKLEPSLNGHAAPATPDSLEARELAERVARALAELPENYEAVLRAKYVDCLSVKAIAEDWGTSAKSIESLLSRARQAFRSLCGDLEHDHHDADTIG